ncbi:FKBP-type peptidyl-prolyl cis-trans isomerase [Pseudoclavibacter helvolus]|uniref:Peptidyl-prolyl cis-trans isomerase n=1 Tax=Pseudoclavibacter helvolus TaxID=255205 RepID=A0A7W4ULM1_9MICO|nr:FKBP-type peptidyl-prolyl cis-trans isomerase [Pseudoclavibacter helvolus]MBB2956458.1 peptidylprolyl isomerase [Pseudoclavibacter helvolus]
MQRRLPAIAAAVLLSLGLASCAGSSTPVATGDALKGVEVTGEYGAAPTITIADVSGLGEEIERRVDIEGDGEEITVDSTVAANLTVYDAGTKAEQSPYRPLGQVLDLSAEGIPEYLTGLFEGVASGSRVVALIPSALLLEGTANAGATDTPPALVVADVIEVPETRAVGAEQESTQSLVTVTDAAEGAPQISIVEGAAAPTELVLETRKLGTGDVVAEGSSVVVQYTGVLFATGEKFDSSWDRGTPAQFSTTGVVDGFAQALVGQTVGSQVVAVIPPALGYGDQASDTIPAGSTLVFVVDILGTI